MWKLITGAAFAGLMSMNLATVANAAEEESCTAGDAYCHQFVKAEGFYRELNPNATDEEWKHMQSLLGPMTDPVSMAETFANPAKLTAWMTGLTDPDAIHLMMRCSQEPVMWNTWLKMLGNPVKMAEATFPFFDPRTYLNWMVAPVNPKVYAGMAPLISVDYYADWLTKATTLKFYEPTWSWAYPQWTIDRVSWAFSAEPYAAPFQWLVDSFSDFTVASN